MDKWWPKGLRKGLQRQRGIRCDEVKNLVIPYVNINDEVNKENQDNDCVVSLPGEPTDDDEFNLDVKG